MHTSLFAIHLCELIQERLENFSGFVIVFEMLVYTCQIELTLASLEISITLQFLD